MLVGVPWGFSLKGKGSYGLDTVEMEMMGKIALMEIPTRMEMKTQLDGDVDDEDGVGDPRQFIEADDIIPH